ncbi:class I adenylate-forming enzyme family protein [Bradyrhizobium sp. dw_78]|uniref:acyl-CoA synthetase n=1 Tax=Bradyrhizobium sp. dw_78 TaxID=2719793 RepID=UPI001BD30E4B|nr:class I adenylate-forming enzyme family protein [Bradyrhizobium sp. dw_78]
MNLAEIALKLSASPEMESRVAFYTGNSATTNAEFRRLVLHIAGQLRTLGLKRGDHVLLRMTNSVEFAASFLAVIWNGGVAALQNSQFGRYELEHVVGLVKPALVLVGGSFRDDASVAGLVPSSSVHLVTTEGIEPVAGSPAVAVQADVQPFQAEPNDPAFIVFTSGTTGRPKGIVHAHRWLEALGDSNRTRIPPRQDDVAFATGEWSFVSALGHNVLFPLRNGISAAILEERASPERILAAVDRHKVTLLYSVATLYRRILGQPGIEKRFDISSLRGVNSTGEPLEPAVKQEWEARFGCPVWEHYGLSEAQMVLGHGPITPPREGSVGVAWGVQPKIVDEAFQPLAANSVGTLVFERDYPGFFLGYLGDPQRTADSFRNGYFLTSDLAKIDEDGFVFILGRSDDCFKSKGVLIAPREIEEALLSLGVFEEACVFAIPDAEIGNRIGAAVVRRSEVETEVDSDIRSLAKSLGGRIAPFKIPTTLVFREALPKNANGKTLRTEVARSFLESA